MHLSIFVAMCYCTSETGSAERIYAPYSVFKGKAALSVQPVPPTFTKLTVRLT